MRPNVLMWCVVVLAGCASSELSKSGAGLDDGAGGAPTPSSNMEAHAAQADHEEPSAGAGMGSANAPDELDEPMRDPEPTIMGGSGGSEPIAGSGGEDDDDSIGPMCDAPGAFDPLVSRDGEVCYELLVHDGANQGEPFMVPTLESYNQFYYDIPWPDDSVATRLGGDYDNLEVLHKWLAFDQSSGSHGLVERNVTGTTLFTEATLFATWTAGSCNLDVPIDAGIELANASSGKKLMIQWHHMNYTGEPQPDASKVQICVVPRSARTNIVSLTVLGTENIPGIGPSQEASYGGTCKNDSGESITLIALWPYMHDIGKRASAEIIRANAAIETVFDVPFASDAPDRYALEHRRVLEPGDSIRAECTYFNHTDSQVAFGQSVAQEQCMQYALAYPAGVLKTGTASLLGALNTCW